MYNQGEILAKIKSTVLEEIPDAKVYLFGSRVTGKVHEESDWDILVITSIEVSRDLNKKVREKLYPGKDEDFFLVDITIVNEKDWEESPYYYDLYLSVKDEVIAI